MPNAPWNTVHSLPSLVHIGEENKTNKIKCKAPGTNGVHDEIGMSLLECTIPITVTVGQERTWTLPKALLTHHSSFFAAALNGKFAEAEAGVVNLPKDDARIFRVFVQWLYLAEIKENYDPITLVQAWALGDKMGCPRFSDQCMPKLVHKQRTEYFAPEMVSFIYQNTPSGSTLRKWAVAQCLYSSYKGLVIGLDEEWAELVETKKDFSADVTKYIAHYGCEVFTNVDAGLDRFLNAATKA